MKYDALVSELEKEGIGKKGFSKVAMIRFPPTIATSNSNSFNKSQ